MSLRSGAPRALRAALVSRALRWAFVVAVLVGGAGYVARFWGTFSAALGELSVPSTLAALAAVLVGLVASMLAYRALLADLGSPLPVAVAARIFFVGQLGKYIPGSLWPVLAQMEMGRDAGVPRQRSATAITLTILIYLGAGVLVGGVALPFSSSSAGPYRWLVLLAPLLLAALHPRIVNPALVRLGALARRPAPERPLTGRGVLQAAGWSVVSWFAFGVQVALVAHDLGAHGARTLPLAVGGFALAWSAGFVVVIAPAGLGPREVVLAALLGGVLARGGPAAVSVVARLLMSSGDLLTAGVAAWAWSRRRPPVR